MKHRHFIFFFLLTIIHSYCLAQINLNHDRPEWDEKIWETKQMKRYLDLAKKRDKAGHVNMDWARWEAWEQIQNTNGKTSRNANWENFGPDTVSGRIISIAFHPTDSNIIYVGAASGGLWKTTDYGQSWQPLTDDYPSLAVGAVAINPLNPNKIVIATGEGYNFGGEFTAGTGILISMDAGQTWSTTSVTANISQGFAGMDIIWSPNDTNKICVATSFGMYFSNDGGYNYTYTLAKMPSRMIADPLHLDTIYLAARYYNSTYPGGFFRSTDAGENWTELTNTGLPVPNDFGYTSLTIHPVYNNIIYASVGRSTVNGQGPLEGLYKSNDYGNTFSFINADTDFLCYHPPYQNICQGWFANTILVMPEDTNLLFAGGTRMWKSTDGGLSWANCDTNQAGNAYAVHPDHHQTLIHPITGKLFDCNDGGVNYTENHGKDWTSISDGLITHQFYTIAVSQTNSDVVIGGTQDVGTFTTTTAHTAGKWNNDFSGDAFGHAIDHQDENTWYATNFMNYQRLRTTDAGSNWMQINSGTSLTDQWRMPMVMNPADNNTLLSSNDLYIYKTTNKGASWQNVAGYGPIGTFEFSTVNPNIVFAAQLFGGGFYKSIDGGSNWAPMSNSPGSPITDLAADPWNEERLYASIGSFANLNQVFKSEDGGATWVNVSGNLPSIPVNSLVVDPFDNQNIYAGTDLGVWVTEDGGTTWVEYNNGLPYVVVDEMHYYQPDSTLRIGTYGRGYWRSKALAPTIPVDIVEKGNPANNFSVYPNPLKTGQNVSLIFNSSYNEVISIQLLNTVGKQVEIWQRQVNKGNSIIEIPVSEVSLSEGLYLMQIQTKDRQRTRKVVVKN